MKQFSRAETLQFLKLPLGKKIDQNFVEKWSSSFWSLTKDIKRDQGDVFVMMFPPPNITGNLHLGHALTASVQDAFIRHRQMQGKRAIWIPGFDHAGLATQNIVEKLLWHQKSVTRNDVGREEFVKLSNEWKDLKRNEMRNQLDRLGLALDHDREYFTMDKNSSRAVSMAFKQLFNQGIIYRSIKPVYYSNQLQTTLSDIEVERIDGANIYTRTGELVEKRPITQWFINAKEMAHRAVEVVESGCIRMIPSAYKRSWSSWLVNNGVEDWCISRQSWWGHRIPTYKLKSAADTQHNWIISDSLEEASRVFGTPKDQVVQDPDVLDTWFSSSLLPLSISGWPDSDKFTSSQEQGFFPLDIMETGFDILNFWVSKMVMMSLVLTGKVPFKLILLHGMICDSEGKKMSKSKGNVIDPLDVMDGASLENLQDRCKDSLSQGILNDKQIDIVLKTQEKLFPNGIPACGADGLRAYLLSQDIQEEVVRIQISQIEKVRRLSNKIWNIYRFVISALEANNTSNHYPEAKLSKLDQQVLHELDNCIKVAEESFCNTYQLHRCFNALDYFWSIHLSSIYIQNIKTSLVESNENLEDKALKLRILVRCLLTSTKLLHPFMPHLTEFLYQYMRLSLMQDKTKVDDIKELGALSLEDFPHVVGD